MKKMKVLLATALVTSLALIVNVRATNLSDEDYARLKLVFSDARISVMSDEEVKKYLSYDLENTNTAHKYYKVTESNNGSYTYTEVSENEAMSAINNYENYNGGIVGTNDVDHTTAYKHILISTTYIGSNKTYVMLDTEWLTTPKVKSFDVTAFRTDDATVVEGTQSGTQVYWDKNTQDYEHVNYAWNGTNIVKKTNGFGISMNLVNSGAYFACDIDADVIATSQYATVYGTYQHAVADVTLAQSQSYNISHNGLGGVLNFSTSVEPYYDRMTGVSIPIDYYG